MQNSYLEFTCVSESDSLYEIIVDEDTKLTKWFKKSEFLKIETWGEYILSSSVIIFEENKFFSDSLESYTIKKESNCLINPCVIHDDWMKVKWNINCYEDSPSIYKYAWMRWKENNTVTIRYWFLI